MKSIEFIVALVVVVVAGATSGAAGRVGAVAAAQDDDARTIEKELGLTFRVSESRLRRSVTSTRTPYGLLIREVAPGSRAARAGLEAGDILLEWDGRPLKELGVIADTVRAGDRFHVALRYSRPRKDVSILSRSPWETRRTSIRGGSTASSVPRDRRDRRRPI